MAKQVLSGHISVYKSMPPDATDKGLTEKEMLLPYNDAQGVGTLLNLPSLSTLGGTISTML